jgi:cytochrome c553
MLMLFRNCRWGGSSTSDVASECEETVDQGLRRAQARSVDQRKPRRSLQLAARAAAIALVLASTAQAADTSAPAVSKHDLQAKIDYCETCHGLSGRGFRGYYPIPRLAGQPPVYLQNQLQAFTEHRRKNIIMFNVAHVLSPEMETALTSYFAGLNPPPLGGAPKDLVSAGKQIYEQGISASDIPPCASCHGADAKGNDAFPRLAGQLNDYIFNKLTNFEKERGQKPEEPDTSAIMQPIAHALTEPQIKAVAAYVSSLE